jgi:hypothetical protein
VVPLAGKERGRLPGCWGAISGFVGGIIGFLLYQLYLRTLPFEERRDVFGPYRHIINEPPRYVAMLAIIGGSLIIAVACTAVIVRRTAAPGAREEKEAAAE